MCSKIRTTKSTENYWEQVNQLRDEIETADAVIVGAGAGLSVSAGFSYSGDRFKTYFSDFSKKYGFHDMYAGGFYPYQTPEEYWAYWSRYVYINRYMDPPHSLYHALLELIESKDYFVLTTNVDHCFQKAKFDKKRLFYTQGDYGLFQCSVPCDIDTYDNEETIRRMVNEQKNGRIPPSLIPVCPKCGKPLTMNLRSDHRFVEDVGWLDAAKRYENFLHRKRKQKVLFLELGVGYNTPGIIKYPFWQMTANNEKAIYACVNMGEAFCPQEIKKQAICIDGDIADVIKSLLEG